MATNSSSSMNFSALNATKNTSHYDDLFSIEVQTMIVVSIILMGLLGNGFVCLAFYHYPSVRSLTNYLIVNLAFGDLLLVTILMLWLVLDRQFQNGNRYVYNTLVSIDILCTSLSMLNLALVGIDRYVAVVHALRYPTIVTKRRVKRCLGFIWSFAFVVAAIAFSRHFVPNKEDRLLFNAPFMMVWASIIFVIPMCIIVFAYAKVFKVAWKQIEWTTKLVHQVHHRNKRDLIKKEIRLSLNLLIIVIPFCTMWGFYFGITLYEAFCAGCFLDFSAKVLFIIGILPHIVAAVNPVIYIFMTKDLRKAFGKAVAAPKKRLSRRRVGMAKTATLHNLVGYLGGHITTRKSHSEDPSNIKETPNEDHVKSNTNVCVIEGTMTHPLEITRL